MLISLFLPWFRFSAPAFLDVPRPGLGWETGAYLAVAAAALAGLPAALPLSARGTGAGNGSRRPAGRR